MNKHIYMFLFLVLIVMFLPVSNGIEILGNKDSVIYVEVKGEVSNPGVFQLPVYSSIDDLIQLLNLTDKADLSTINLTTTLKNHDVIVIPETISEAKISINSADLEMLMKIPGVGETIGKRIISYRNKYGSFQKLEDLMKVKGIGKKKFAQLKEYIKL